MLQPLDGPSKQDAISIDDITVIEVKIDASPLDERKVITLQPNGKIRVFFGDGSSVPNAATVLAKGFLHYKNAVRSYEASDSQTVYMIAETGGATEVIVAERA